MLSSLSVEITSNVISLNRNEPLSRDPITERVPLYLLDESGHLDFVPSGTKYVMLSGENDLMTQLVL